MRLIDKDATLKAMKDDPVGRMVAEKYNMDGWLEGLQEVNTIPVDWIKRYMKEVGLTDVRYMLETWEKEQIYGKID